MPMPRYRLPGSIVRGVGAALTQSLLGVLIYTSSVITHANTGIDTALDIPVGYLELIQPRPPLLSNVLPPPEDNGEQGAHLGITDNNQGARFLGMNYRLLVGRSEHMDELLQLSNTWHQQGVRYLITNLPASELTQLSKAWADKPMVIFNAGESGNTLRTRECLTNVLHTLPSRAMLTDALGQWLIRRKLSKWLLITGQKGNDKAYAHSLKRTAKRFGAKIVDERLWTFESDLRRTAQQEIPLFTKAKSYDVVAIADEQGDFGEFIPYNTWLPRPVVGTQGMVPTGWHRVVEQWGAAQLQSRFDQQAGRWMTDKDYAAWVAVRAIGEALASQRPDQYQTLGREDPTPLARYLLSDQFQLAGFKGRKLTFRSWNGQLRQPIPLVQPRALVSQSPQNGFLHPHTDLDTLGFDRPESQCNLNQHYLQQEGRS